jgi:hypothetical protein
MIANIPRMMNRMAATMYQPVNRFAVPRGEPSVAM